MVKFYGLQRPSLGVDPPARSVVLQPVPKLPLLARGLMRIPSRVEIVAYGAGPVEPGGPADSFIINVGHFWCGYVMGMLTCWRFSFFFQTDLLKITQ